LHKCVGLIEYLLPTIAFV